MKTAILISGHMRSFDKCLPTLHWHVFRHFPRSDFFVSTEPDEDAPKAELLRAKYPFARVEIDYMNQPSRHVIPPDEGGILMPPREAILVGAADHAPYSISVSVEAVLGQLWRLEQCWKSIEPKTDTLDYDVIIRCRPDLWFESARLDLSLTHWGIQSEFSARTPWWGRFGGVNDRFALLGCNAAFEYFTTYSKISTHLAAGCPLHPESLIKASLDRAGCEIDDTLDVSFSTLRSNGERRFPEIMAQDIAHFRGR